MFTLYDEDPICFYPVSVEQPSEKGELVAATFDAGFRYLENPQVLEIMQRVESTAKADNPENPGEGGITDDQLIDIILGGWRNLIGADGADVPFTEENKNKLLRKRGVKSAIVQAWFDSLTKKAEEREGN